MIFTKAITSKPMHHLAIFLATVCILFGQSIDADRRTRGTLAT